MRAVEGINGSLLLSLNSCQTIVPLFRASQVLHQNVFFWTAHKYRQEKEIDRETTVPIITHFVRRTVFFSLFIGVCSYFSKGQKLNTCCVRYELAAIRHFWWLTFKLIGRFQSGASQSASIRATLSADLLHATMMTLAFFFCVVKVCNVIGQTRKQELSWSAKREGRKKNQVLSNKIALWILSAASQLFFSWLI